MTCCAYPTVNAKHETAFTRSNAEVGVYKGGDGEDARYSVCGGGCVEAVGGRQGERVLE